MNIIEPYYVILTDISEDGVEELKTIEKAARTCYKSEDKIDDSADSAKNLIKKLIDSGHEAMLEHSILSVKFICDRGISHELVRHRMASFAQESTRYCNYSKDKFDNQITVIKPCFLKEETEPYICWTEAMELAEKKYFSLLNYGLTPQEARSVLPNSLKTEIVVTANYREWRHILDLRCDKAAHPQIRELMLPLLADLKNSIPVIFDDLFEKFNLKMKEESQNLIVTKMTKDDFDKIPVNKTPWNNDTEPFKSLVIIPSKHMHESGYRMIDFVTVDNTNHPIERVQEGSDVLDLDGLGGYGPKYTGSKRTTDWTIDMLPCGYVRLFADKPIYLGALRCSNTAVYAVEEKTKCSD